MTLPAEGGQTFPPLGSQSSLASGGMMPTLILSTETFTVPTNRQALFGMPIDVQGLFVIDGFLIEVT